MQKIIKEFFRHLICKHDYKDIGQDIYWDSEWPHLNNLRMAVDKIYECQKCNKVNRKTLGFIKRKYEHLYSIGIKFYD